MANYIPYVYGKSNNKRLIEAIEKAREDSKKYDKYNNSYMPKWWICGSCICTQLNNGYYHAYTLEKSALYGKILKDYRISRDGEMVDTDKFYIVPTKADFERWCAERDITI